MTSTSPKSLMAASLISAVLATLGLLVTAGLATSAFAGNPGEVRIHEDGVRDMDVVISDLNLDDPLGWESLEKRIDFAAKKVCEAEIGRVPVKTAVEKKNCISFAKRQAMLSLKNASNVRMAARSDTDNVSRR